LRRNTKAWVNQKKKDRDRPGKGEDWDRPGKGWDRIDVVFGRIHYRDGTSDDEGGSTGFCWQWIGREGNT
jgi:hypothetical protein